MTPEVGRRYIIRWEGSTENTIEIVAVNDTWEKLIRFVVVYDGVLEKDQVEKFLSKSFFDKNCVPICYKNEIEQLIKVLEL